MRLYWAFSSLPMLALSLKPAAGDGLQRPLVPRSRFQPRLSRSVRSLPNTDILPHPVFVLFHAVLC